jgi:hypothetical protein
MPTESSQWRKFLQPVVTGLVALMAAATLYLQRQDSGDTDARVKALEVRVEEQVKRSDKFSDDIDKFRAVLSDIRSDVSFIRGRLEQQ